MTNNPCDQLLSSYDYELPSEKIAQAPVDPRDSSQLLVVESPSSHRHVIFRQLGEFLKSGDLLVFNNTKVIPARLYGQKPTGSAVEVLLLEKQGPKTWLALVKPGRRLKVGAEILFHPPAGESSPIGVLKARITARDEATGGRVVEFEYPGEQPLETLLEIYGRVPLPPYLGASELEAELTPEQEAFLTERYQTVYAQEAGAVAAPTAGLHFTSELMGQLAQQGIAQTYITLHIGVGTFRPVETEDITSHVMHEEWAEVSPQVVEKIRQTKANGGRVIAVGTTVVRSLESAGASGEIQPFCDKTNLFIYPGYKWRVVDGLITNFHLPRSSLMMLVSALIGRERLLNLYQEAIAQNYRFYSFGDAMLILPEARITQ